MTDEQLQKRAEEAARRIEENAGSLEIGSPSQQESIVPFYRDDAIPIIAAALRGVRDSTNHYRDELTDFHNVCDDAGVPSGNTGLRVRWLVDRVWKVRGESIEECAKVADAEVELQSDCARIATDVATSHSHIFAGRSGTARAIAAAIRKLKEAGAGDRSAG